MRRVFSACAWRRLFVRGAFAIGGGSLLACDTPTAARPMFAYDPTSLSAGTLYRWPSGRRVAVYLEPVITTGMLDFDDAVEQALREWNQVPQFGEFILVRTQQRASADIIIFVRGTMLPVATGRCPFTPSGATGYTYFCANNGRADTVIFSGVTGTAATVAIQLDPRPPISQESLTALLTHEMGHAVGIGGHSPDARDVMFVRPSATIPTVRDRQTLRYLLGRPADIGL